MKKKLNISMFPALFIMLGFLLIHFTSSAQTITPTASKSTISTAELINYSLLVVAIVLGVGIMIISNALSTLSKEKMKGFLNKSKKLIPVLIISTLLVSNFTFAQGTSAQSPTSNALVWTEQYTTYILIAVILFEGIAYVFLAAGINRLSKPFIEKSQAEEAKSVLEPQKSFWDSFNESVAVEKEQDILLDHNYDGIKELDNDLPPWWKYGFYFSLAISVIYLMHYHVFGTGKLQYQEYESEMEEAKIKVEEYRRLAANNVDETTVSMADASGISDGKSVFAENCVACHGSLGEGASVGPNLTDAYWLHGGDIKDIFKTIKYGYPEKGMRSWQSELSPVQMQNLSSYILSIQGSNPPNAKAPQGTLYKAGQNDAGNEAGINQDSSSVAIPTIIDSTKL